LKKFTENDTRLKRSTVPRAGVQWNLQWGTVEVVEHNYSAHNGFGLISVFQKKNWVSHQNNKQFYICFLGERDGGCDTILIIM